MARDKHPIQGGVEILLIASCFGNRDTLRPDGPLGSHTDFTFTLLMDDAALSSRTILLQSSICGDMCFNSIKDSPPPPSLRGVHISGISASQFELPLGIIKILANGFGPDWSRCQHYKWRVFGQNFHS